VNFVTLKKVGATLPSGGAKGQEGPPAPIDQANF
jgi:hypothetical protein